MYARSGRASGSNAVTHRRLAASGVIAVAPQAPDELRRERALLPDSSLVARAVGAPDGGRGSGAVARNRPSLADPRPCDALAGVRVVDRRRGGRRAGGRPRRRGARGAWWRTTSISARRRSVSAAPAWRRLAAADVPAPTVASPATKSRDALARDRERDRQRALGQRVAGAHLLARRHLQPRERLGDRDVRQRVEHGLERGAKADRSAPGGRIAAGRGSRGRSSASRW